MLETVVPRRLGSGFRWLLASSWMTNLGDGIALAAGPLLVASLTDDAFLVALAALLQWLPPLVFGLYAGVLSDRLDRRRIVMVADGSASACWSRCCALMVADRFSVAGALVALGLLATAEVFADNTATTLLPMLVHRDDLALANSRLQTGFITVNQLVGPPIGAALFAAGHGVCRSPAQAVLVALGVAAGLADRAARRTAATAAAETQRAARHRRGLPLAVRHPAVRTLVLTIFIFNVTFGAAWSVLVLYATAAARAGRGRLRPAHHGLGGRRAARHRCSTAGSPAGSAWATSCGSG